MKKSYFIFTYDRAVLTIKVGALLSAILIFYHQDLATVGNEAVRNELASYIIIIPFLIAYLIYRKRKMLRAVIAIENQLSLETFFTYQFPGVLLCLLAFALYWHGSSTFYPLEYHLLSLPIFLAGCILIIFNLKTLKVLAFPTAFLLLLMPPPLELAQKVGANLATFSSQAAAWFLNVIGMPVKLITKYGNPTLILQTKGSSLSFTMDIACSGIYSLIGFTVFVVLLAYLARGPVWKKMVVFSTGFSLLYALNIFRVILIVLIGYYFGLEIALGVFHHFGGWILIFVATIAVLYFSEKIFKVNIFHVKSNKKEDHCYAETVEKDFSFCINCGKIGRPPSVRISKLEIGKIAVILMCLILLNSLNVPVFTFTKGPPEVVTYSPDGKVTTNVFPEIQDYTLRFVYRDQAFERESGQDASLLYAYVPNASSGLTIWLSVEIASSKGPLHSWEVCLLYSPESDPQSIQVLDIREIRLLENPSTIGKFFSFKRTNSDFAQVILYWYETSFFDTGSTIEQKFVKMSLIADIDVSENYTEIEESLIPFAEEITEYWQPLKTWPWITLMIAAQGKTIILVLIILIVILLATSLLLDKRKRNYNYRVYEKLRHKEEKNILLAVYYAQNSKPVGSAIASSYKTLTGKTIDINRLQDKLMKLEEAGLVTLDISSLNDEPVIIWKTPISFPQGAGIF